MSRIGTLEGNAPRKGITGWHVLAALLGFFITVTSVNGVMIYQALKTFGGIETKDAYRQGVAYNTRIEQEAAQARLGWADTVSLTPTNDRVSLTLTGHDGAPVRGLAIKATLGRPATNKYDQSLTLAEAAPGTYEATVIALATGSWTITIEAANDKGEAIYTVRRRLWVKP